MSRSSLQDAAGLPDPLLVYNFDFYLPRIPGFSGSARAMTIKCQTTALPGMQVEQVTSPLHGIELNYAGRQIWTKTFNSTFVETTDGETRRAIRQWMKWARDNKNNRGAQKYGTNGYAITGTIYQYDDVPNVINEISVNGLWPTNLEDVTMDGSQSGIVSVSVTWSYDWTDESQDEQ